MTRSLGPTQRSALVALLVLSLIAPAGLAATGAAQSSSTAAVTISNVTASTETPTVDEPFSLQVTISNYEQSQSIAELNNLAVYVDGKRQYVARDIGQLAPGSQTTLSVPVTAVEAGQQTVVLKLYGTAANGNVVNTQTTFVTQVRDVQRPRLSVSVADAVVGATRDINITVGNGLEYPIENVVLRANSSADAVSFNEEQRVRGQMAAGETRTFTFPAEVSETGRFPVNVSLTYLDRGTQHTVTETFWTRFGEPANPGRVILSGVDATQRGSTLELSATASNVGGTEVGGVVVSISESEAVSPQTYFVGSIESSGFSTFTLETSTDSRVERIPVDVTYVTGDVEQTVTTEIVVDAPTTPDPREEQGNQGLLSALPLSGVGIVVVVIVVLVVGLIRRRRA